MKTDTPAPSSGNGIINEFEITWVYHTLLNDQTPTDSLYINNHSQSGNALSVVGQTYIVFFEFKASGSTSSQKSSTFQVNTVYDGVSSSSVTSYPDLILTNYFSSSQINQHARECQHHDMTHPRLCAERLRCPSTRTPLHVRRPRLVHSETPVSASSVITSIAVPPPHTPSGGRYLLVRLSIDLSNLVGYTVSIVSAVSPTSTTGTTLAYVDSLVQSSSVLGVYQVPQTGLSDPVYLNAVYITSSATTIAQSSWFAVYDIGLMNALDYITYLPKRDGTPGLVVGTPL